MHSRKREYYPISYVTAQSTNPLYPNHINHITSTTEFIESLAQDLLWVMNMN